MGFDGDVQYYLVPKRPERPEADESLLFVMDPCALTKSFHNMTLILIVLSIYLDSLLPCPIVTIALKRLLCRCERLDQILRFCGIKTTQFCQYSPAN
ncbi:unnamed protein product [Gongylonema pulchrum]|uniref:Uncharacterized protein n=1 Tax=Gongylonema pulchrum TaxID=637853 RepID=A0A183DXG2_9BILA|nr:unnamed protein product [Gongylonema pulchrum]